ncbi:MAG: ABC transporter permease [Ilumatobacteraceae bacterium]
MTPSPMRLPMQVIAFVRKEIADVVHQPSLLLTLVVGPFLVLAALGVGYRDTTRPMTTMFVVADDSPVRDSLEQYADDLDDFVRLAGVTDDATLARRALMDGDVDLVVVFPEEPIDAVLAGEQAEVEVVHTRLDPIERTAIAFASRLAVDQINSEVLAAVVGEGQAIAMPADEAIAAGHDAIAAMRDAMANDDPDRMAAASGSIRDVVVELGATVRAAGAFDDELGAAGDGVSTPGGEAGRVLDEFATELAEIERDPGAVSAERLDDLDRRLDAVGTALDTFLTADPDVLVRPLRAVVDLAVDDVDRVTDWYAPAAVILVLQQFGVAFGALSFVRERQLGILDVFRVAPVGAAATVIGKYLAYLVMGLAVGAVLTAAVVVVLDVPSSGDPIAIGVTMALTLFASIGLGLVISLASRTDAQAVQFTMITLLASLFFSGFFLSSEQLRGPAAAIGWLLPVTYGMRALRDVMLRGADLDPEVVLAFGGYGLVVFLVAVMGAARRLGVVGDTSGNRRT